MSYRKICRIHKKKIDIEVAAGWSVLEILIYIIN